MFVPIVIRQDLRCSTVEFAMFRMTQSVQTPLSILDNTTPDFEIADPFFFKDYHLSSSSSELYDLVSHSPSKPVDSILFERFEPFGFWNTRMTDLRKIVGKQSNKR